MDIILPELHINQEQIFESDARFRVVMCGRRFGKSELSQVEIITKALLGKQVAYITPTYQLAKNFFSKLIQTLPFANNKSDLIIEFPNNGKVEFFTGERLDNLRGRKFHFVVVDEASFIPDLENGWLNSIRPTLTDYKGKALFLSTPRGKNYFYSLFMKNENDWKSFKFSTYDNPYIDANEIDDAKGQLPAPVFEQEYMANPMENASNPFGISYIDQCTYPISNDMAVCYGIDLAKSNDFTVIIGLDKNGSVCHFDRFQKDWRQTTQTILELPKANLIIDSTGVGDPVAEDIARIREVDLFKFTSSSKQQIMEGLAMGIHQRRITFPDGLIKKELENFEFTFTSNGVRYSAPSGFHDDCVCALAMAWHKYRTASIYSGHYSMI